MDTAEADNHGQVRYCATDQVRFERHDGGDWVELTDRFLRVRGSMRTYRVHLGSGNILVEPNDTCLCIVAAQPAPSSRLFLPFEDDRLSLILSKAFLLADDAKITDETILQQIKQGG